MDTVSHISAVLAALNKSGSSAFDLCQPLPCIGKHCKDITLICNFQIFLQLIDKINYQTLSKRLHNK